MNGSHRESDLPLKYEILAFASGASAASGLCSYAVAATGLKTVFGMNSGSRVAILVVAGTLLLAASALGMKTFFTKTEQIKPAQEP